MPESSGESYLIVEDERDVAEVIGLVLQDISIRSKIVAGTDEAEKALADETFDGLIVDGGFDTGLSGVKLVKSLRQQDEYKDVPILVISAGTMPDDLGEEVLSKPFDLDALEAKINQIRYTPRYIVPR